MKQKQLTKIFIVIFFAIITVLAIWCIVKKTRNPKEKAEYNAKNIERIIGLDLPEILGIWEPEEPKDYHSEEYMMDTWENSEYITYTYNIVFIDYISKETLSDLHRLCQKDEHWDSFTDNGNIIYHYSGKRNFDFFISEGSAKVRYYHPK